jgi:hypothetical protein
MRRAAEHTAARVETAANGRRLVCTRQADGIEVTFPFGALCWRSWRTLT